MMKLNLFLSISFCLCFRAAWAGDFKLYFEDGLPFDFACESLKKDENYKNTESMREELTKRIPEFEKLWEAKGAELVDTLPLVLKHSYGRKEESIALTLCQWFSPMSNPLMLRIREYLKTTAVANPKGPQEQKPESYFVGQVFHELIHRYIDRHFPDIDQPGFSGLLKAHSKESPGVRIHLHHLSILKAIYLKLNRKTELEVVEKLDSQIHGGIYKRAWEIINADGHQKYIDELLKYKGPK